VPSLTVENYVKSICQITSAQEGRPATTGQIAAALGVSPGTVTSMLKTLDTARLATHRPYEGVSLTRAGRALALRMIRRHRLIELFLMRTLGMSWDAVHDEAEHMEHAMSDLLIDRIDEFLGHPDVDPHGAPSHAATPSRSTPKAPRGRSPTAPPATASGWRGCSISRPNSSATSRRAACRSARPGPWSGIRTAPA